MLASQLEQLYGSPQLDMLRSEMTAWVKEHRVASSAIFKVGEADVARPGKWQAQSVDTGRPTNFSWPRLVFKCVPSASDQESLYRMAVQVPRSPGSLPGPLTRPLRIAVQVAQIVGPAFAVLARLRYEESSQVRHIPRITTGLSHASTMKMRNKMRNICNLTNNRTSRTIGLRLRATCCSCLCPRCAAATVDRCCVCARASGSVCSCVCVGE